MEALKGAMMQAMIRAGLANAAEYGRRPW